MGFKKARIQDVARLAGVADGTIYQHFKNKQELLFALPVENTRELTAIVEEHLRGPNDPDLRLSMLLTDYLAYLDSRKEYGSVVLLDLRYNRHFYGTPGYDLFRKFARLYYDAVRQGQREGAYRRDRDAHLAVKMIFGTIDHTMLSLLMFQRPESLLSLTDAISGMVLNALRN